MIRSILKYSLFSIFYLSITFFCFKALYDSRFYQVNFNFNEALAYKDEIATNTDDLLATSSKITSEVNLDGKNDLLVVPMEKYLPIQRFDSSELPKLSAKCVSVIDEKSGKELLAINSNVVQPIASITKLMTALVFLENNPGWDYMYTMVSEDRREGGRIYLFTGDTVTAKNLFDLSLIASDNTATIALARSTRLSEQVFVQKMNEKAMNLGLANTRFVEPVGLDSGNVSSSFEVARLAKAALEQEEIHEATTKSACEFLTRKGKKIIAQSTDYLIKKDPADGLFVVGGKTGYIDTSGYCFVGKFNRGAGENVISVALNSSTYITRFDDSKKAAEWAFDNFIWR
jgi:D-alanyl-D-alanine endopeptidase (penicillin-binding protein 7)